MPDGIGDGFLPNSKQRVFHLERHIAATILALCFYFDASVLHHPLGALTKGWYQPDVTQRLRTQRRDAAPRLFMAGARHCDGPVNLAFEKPGISRHAVADCLELKPDSCKAL